MRLRLPRGTANAFVCESFQRGRAAVELRSTSTQPLVSLSFLMTEDGRGPAVAVRDLCVRRGRRVALDGVSFSVRRGTIVGLLGPSGSGKTTLMRAVVGVQRIQTGTVTVLGELAGAPRLRRQVAYMTQAASVYADLEVVENLEFFANVLGVPASRVGEVVDTVALGGYEHDLVGRLSDGQRVRVSLATALLGQPELLVLDEPTVGLDPVLRRDLWRAFRDLAGAGSTLLVSSHVMDEARHCDELVLLRDGVVLATGTPAQLQASTGTPDMDAAFLALVEAREPAP
jgi:ABC-2 type transport system ATP-binding protein